MSTSPDTEDPLGPAAMATVKSWQGVPRQVRGWNSECTEDAIWHFANGVGDDNPLWWDARYGRGTRWGSMIAPPTWLYSCSSGGLSPHDDTGMYPAHDLLPDTGALWATDTWEFQRPVRVGEAVKCTAELTEVAHREGRHRGRTVGLTERFRYTTARGQRLADCHREILRFDPREQTRAPADPAEAPSYSEQELAEIAEQYDREPQQRRGATPRRWSSTRVGESLGRLVKGPLTVTSLVAWVMGWGSPLCQTNRVAHRYFRNHPTSRLTHPSTGIPDTLEGPHWDSSLARETTGLPRGYDFGGQRISWIVHLLTDWYGDDAHLEHLRVRLRAPNLLGDATWITGSVVERLDHERVACEVVTNNQRGQTTATAEAIVQLSD